jgi:photosystem II stability/assembly factor-like uncharacterized protein
MKLLKVILFLNFLSSTVLTQSNWQWILPDPPVKRVYSSVEVDNKAFLWCADNCIIKLDISTERFEIMPVYARYDNTTLGDFTEQGIAFADSMTGYLTDISKGEFRTTDGGRNWLRKSSTGSFSYLVAFGSKSRGWKLGGGGLYITNNAGENWSMLPAAPFFFSGYNYLTKIFALNENQLWVLVSFHYQGNEGSIYYSSNAGSSWRKLNTGLISNNSHQVRYTDIKINPSGIGFAIGNITKPDSNVVISFVQRTTDMGETWSTTLFREGVYKNILSISDNEWIMLGNEPGYFYADNYINQRKTTDMGITWIHSRPLSALQDNPYLYNSIFTKANQTVYLFTISGIFKSFDKGETYHKITSGKDLPLTNIIFDSKPLSTSNQVGIAYVQFYRNKYLLTTDAGYTWQLKSLPDDNSYIWMVGISENVIYMITEQTKIIKSTDLGNTWIRLYPPIYGSAINSLDVYNKNELVLTSYKKLVSSTDGGNDWIIGPIISNIFFTGVDISSSGRIFGCGIYFDAGKEKGFLFNTTDYGYSWRVIDFESKFTKIQMLNDRIGYALSKNVLLKTQDSGKSWIPILQPSDNGRFDSFIFSDSLRGIVNEDDKFHITNIGGSRWTINYISAPIRFMSDMAFNVKGDLFLISKGTMVMIPSSSNFIPGLKNNFHDNIITEFKLYQNYPNPFNPSTTISWQLPVSGRVTIKLFDMLGREIETIVDGYFEAGKHSTLYIANSALSSGVYFYQLKTENYIETKKMTLLK